MKKRKKKTCLFFFYISNWPMMFWGVICFVFSMYKVCKASWILFGYLLSVFALILGNYFLRLFLAIIYSNVALAPFHLFSLPFNKHVYSTFSLYFMCPLHFLLYFSYILICVLFWWMSTVLYSSSLISLQMHLICSYIHVLSP